jgi:predicted ATPase/class 3 adenylate cyclase
LKPELDATLHPSHDPEDMRRDLPAGTVTFLFTDVEGSTKLLHELGAEAYAATLAEHRRIVREACTARSGVEVDTQGDAFFVAFPTAPAALEAARAIGEELASGPIALRIGLHTGTPLLTEEGYVGEDVHVAARVAASAHGGQVVLSQATRALFDELYPLVELGEHRLKDIPEPVAIYQLGDGRFPPLKTISNTNLPRPASSFVGRERELQDVLARIGDGARLVTLTGPGGSGKTRLALEVAATLVPEYKAGVFWIGLASLRDPALVSETIAQTLGAKDGLGEHIGEREILLLLDNLEQVIEAAPTLSALLSSCSNLTLLVTSRELLRVLGEIEYPVPPLSEAEAVSLFCERAQTAASEEIRKLCRRLDNLPLAVELAAARVKALSPEQILDRLSQRLDLLKGGRDAEARQQTLRATIAWSYDLLAVDEQQLFHRLAVFSGGCTLGAAEEVAEAELDTLQSLVEKSLVRFTNERYWLLETIREYAAEQLKETGKAERLRRRHAAYYLVLAEEAKPELEGGPAQSAWLERLERERDNFRASLTWAQEADVGLGLRLSAALVVFWDIRGPIGEARAWISTLLERAGTDTLDLQAKVLPWAGDYALVQGDHEEAQTFGEKSLGVARQLGDPMAIGRALHDLGEVAARRREYERARQLYEEAISTVSEVGYPAPGSIHNLGDLALIQHDYERASDLFRRALALFREQGKGAGAAMALSSLATVELRRRRYAESLSLLEQSLELTRKLGYDEVSLYCLLELAALLAAQGRGQDAACLLGASETALKTVGIRLGPADEETRATAVEAVEALLDVESRAEAAASGRSMSIDEAIAHGLQVAHQAVAPPS